jgi:hypothetical protein
MGERCNRTAEVGGSNPPSSTKTIKYLQKRGFVDFFRGYRMATESFGFLRQRPLPDRLYKLAPARAHAVVPIDSEPPANDAAPALTDNSLI